MCMTVKLFVDYKGHKAGKVLCLAANTALELITSGKARVAEWGDM